MAIIIPYVKQTWVDGPGGGTPTSAARLGVIEEGVLDVSLSPTVRTLRSAVQTITTGTWTLLLWNTETGGWDQAGGAASTMHDNSTNTGRLTAQFAGKYLVVLNLEILSNTTGVRLGYIQKNSEALPATVGTGVVQGGFVITPSTPATNYASATALVDLAVNDYVAAVYFQNSGGNLDNGVDSSFAMTRIA